MLNIIFSCRSSVEYVVEYVVECVVENTVEICSYMILSLFSSDSMKNEEEQEGKNIEGKTKRLKKQPILNIVNVNTYILRKIQNSNS